jgi:hypothetical protein
MFVNIFYGLALFVFILLMPLTGMAEETDGKENQTQQWALTLGLFTRHVNPSDDTNERTRMLGLSYSNWFILGFKNSYHDQTFFGGKRLQTKKIHNSRNTKFFLRGNLYAGLMYGYGDRFINFSGITPAPVPTVEFGYKNTSIEVLYFPTPSGGVFSSVLTFRF